jgi:hypothetical protein
MDGFDLTDPMEETDSPSPVEEMRGLLGRARLGDESVLPQLRALLDSNPELWERLGDLAAHAVRAWVELASGQNLIVRESLSRKLDDLKAELAGPDPTLLERLMAERAAACWLQVSFTDAAMAQAKEVSLQQAAYLSKRQDAAHRRYLTALGALAAMRRLLPRDGPAEVLREIPADRPLEVGRIIEVGDEDASVEPPAVAVFPPSRASSGPRRRSIATRKTRKSSSS